MRISNGIKPPSGKYITLSAGKHLTGRFASSNIGLKEVALVDAVYFNDAYEVLWNPDTGLLSASDGTYSLLPGDSILYYIDFSEAESESTKRFVKILNDTNHLDQATYEMLKMMYTDAPFVEHPYIDTVLEISKKEIRLIAKYV